MEDSDDSAGQVLRAVGNKEGLPEQAPKRVAFATSDGVGERGR